MRMKASLLGPLAYMKRSDHSSAIRPLNKDFLANTIRSVESHNRREEIDSCWKQHELREKNRRKVDEEAVAIDVEAEKEREFWARKKLKAFATSSSTSIEPGAIDEIEEEDSSINSSRGSSSEAKKKTKENKRDKDERKKKKKKAKKFKKAKKEKRKKEKK